MAKGRKGKRKGRRYHHKKVSRGRKAVPLAFGLGALGSAVEGLSGKTPTYGMSVMDTILTKAPLKDRIGGTGRTVKDKLMDWNTWKYAVAGAIISASPNLPGVKIVMRPLATQVKKLSKGKMTL